MNKNIYKLLLTGDQFMSELHSKQPGFTRGPLTNYRKRIQKFRETSNLKELYRNKLDKTWFAYGTAYSDSKDLTKRTISDKILKDTDEMLEITTVIDINVHYKVLSIIFLIRKQDWEQVKMNN